MALYRFGYRFNMFEFDSSTGELVKEGCCVRLRPQAARAFECLLERHGQLVSRGELQRAIWPEGTFVHFDHGLNSCVKQIRAAIGDSRSAPRYVETLVKRGFRFVAHRSSNRTGRIARGLSLGRIPVNLFPVNSVFPYANLQERRRERSDRRPARHP